jgi:uncharacterized protein
MHCFAVLLEFVMTVMILTFLALFVFYWVAAISMYACQRHLVYRRDSRRVDPSGIGLNRVRERILATSDGVRLVAWHAPASAGQPTLLYLHGNSGSLYHRGERVRRYVNAGIGILMLAFRGYSGSEGDPSEEANVGDAVMAYDWLMAQGVSAESIVVYGESLGTGVAAQVATHRKISGIVLDSPFTSLVDVAALRHRLLPVRRFIWDRYETLQYAPRITSPALVLHGERDHIVPFEMGRQVFEALAGPKRLIAFPEGRHLDHTRFGSFENILGFLGERAHLGQGYRRIERRLQEPNGQPLPAGIPVRA